MAGPKGGGGPSDQDGIRDDLLQVGSRLQDGHKIRPPKARSVEGRLGRRASLLSQSAHVVGAYWWRRPSGRKRQRRLAPTAPLASGGHKVAAGTTRNRGVPTARLLSSGHADQCIVFDTERSAQSRNLNDRARLGAKYERTFYTERCETGRTTVRDLRLRRGVTA